MVEGECGRDRVTGRVRVALQRGGDGVGGAPARELVGVQAGVCRSIGDQPGVVDQAGLHDPDTHTAQQRVDLLGGVQAGGDDRTARQLAGRGRG